MLVKELRNKVNQAYRSRPESVGTPILTGFNLAVLPPWSDYDESEVLRVEITSAAVCCIVNEKYVLMVHHNSNEEGFEDRCDLPGGSREIKDTSPQEMALREFWEETGFSLTPNSMEPFGYAFRKKKGERRGGLQYLANKSIRIPSKAVVDENGRVFMKPRKGATASEIDMLVLEPIDIFMSEESMLNSPHFWAYKSMFRSLERRFSRINSI